MVQSVVGEEVANECESRVRVSWCSEIFEEGDLHFCSWELHSRVPCKLWLSFEEGYSRLLGARWRLGFLESDGDGEGCWSETNAYQVLDIV